MTIEQMLNGLHDMAEHTAGASAKPAPHAKIKIKKIRRA